MSVVTQAPFAPQPADGTANPSSSNAGAHRGAGASGTLPEITLITKRGPAAIMTKRIFLDESGALRTDGSQCRMADGIATRAVAASPRELAECIAACGPDTALALGALKPDLPSQATIVTKRELPQHPGAITRSRDWIDYRPGAPAWALIDFDAKGMPPEVATCIEVMGGHLAGAGESRPGVAGRSARAAAQHE